MKQQVPGEAQLSEKMLSYILPDLYNEAGVQKVGEKLHDADFIKSQVDPIIQQIAELHGGEMRSRVKQPEVFFKKMAQKRLEGRIGYDIEDINDTVGHRIIVDKEKIPDVINSIRDSKLTILKQQRVKNDESQYEAYHMDLEHQLPNGKKITGELQIMTPQDEASAAITHDAHYVHGEEIPKNVQRQIDPIVDDAKELPDMKAKQVANTIVELRKANGDQPLPAIIPATVVGNAK